jgi:Fe-S cluster biogenesis protein NfuA
MVGIVSVGLLHFRAARQCRRWSVRQQVEETIEVIRPALQADGGDIFLREVDE